MEIHASTSFVSRLRADSTTRWINAGRNWTRLHVNYKLIREINLHINSDRIVWKLSGRKRRTIFDILHIDGLTN